jgi:hypothetical protein
VVSPTILLVEASVPEELEARWNRWYDEVHLPEILACPGFRSGQRYVTEADGARRYVALYELDGPKALESADFRARRGWGEFTGSVTFRTSLFTALKGGEKQP